LYKNPLRSFSFLHCNNDVLFGHNLRCERVLTLPALNSSLHTMIKKQDFKACVSLTYVWLQPTAKHGYKR